MSWWLTLDSVSTHPDIRIQLLVLHIRKGWEERGAFLWNGFTWRRQIKPQCTSIGTRHDVFETEHGCMSACNSSATLLQAIVANAFMKFERFGERFITQVCSCVSAEHLSMFGRDSPRGCWSRDISQTGLARQDDGCRSSLFENSESELSMLASRWWASAEVVDSYSQLREVTSRSRTSTYITLLALFLCSPVTTKVLDHFWPKPPRPFHFLCEQVSILSFERFFLCLPCSKTHVSTSALSYLGLPSSAEGHSKLFLTLQP